MSNPAASGGAVQFVVNGEVLAAARREPHLQRLGSLRVQFHRGGEFGYADLTMAAGAYAFKVTERGWDLQPALSTASRKLVSQRTAKAES